MSSPDMENQQPEYKKSENIMYKIKKNPQLAFGLGLIIFGIILMAIFLSVDVVQGVAWGVVFAVVGAFVSITSTLNTIR